MRPWHCLLILAAAQPALAAASEPPYYGPMKAWRGIGYKFGYKEEPQKDGSWRVTATTRGREAIDMAMYRAAQLAEEQGFAYVELLGGSASDSPGMASATVFARPSRTAAAPATCRSKQAGTCYTAVVKDLMRKLGGAGGSQPGVAVVDHYDKYGRAVSYSGFGVGTALPPSSRPLPTTRPTQAPVAAPASSAAVAPRATPATEYDRMLKAAQPVRGREPAQGWTVSD